MISTEIQQSSPSLVYNQVKVNTVATDKTTVKTMSGEHWRIISRLPQKPVWNLTKTTRHMSTGASLEIMESITTYIRCLHNKTDAFLVGTVWPCLNSDFSVLESETTHVW